MMPPDLALNLAPFGRPPAPHCGRLAFRAAPCERLNAYVDARRTAMGTYGFNGLEGDVVAQTAAWILAK